VGAGAVSGDWSGYSTGKISWFDGVPDASSSNEDGYYWSNGDVGTGFSFTMPADSSVRTIMVYAGACDATAQIVAHLSDGSAPDYVDSSLVNKCSSGSTQAFYAITYHAASSGQSLTVSLIKAAEANGTRHGRVDLIAAALIMGMPIVPPPAPDITAVTAGNGQIAVSWNPVDGATSYSIFRSTTPGGEFESASIQSGLANTTYTDIGLTNGATYYYAVAAVGQGGSTLSAGVSATPAPPVPGSGGALTGTFAPASATGYNLTDLGTSDWVVWGYNGWNTYPRVDHKAAGAGEISDVGIIGPGALWGDWGGFNTGMVSWTDGTPDTSEPNDQFYYWSNGNVGTGFTFTVPAGTNPRTLMVDMGACNVTAQLVAHLSDNSAPDYADSSIVNDCSNGSTQGFYTITYHAASAGQTLTISLVKAAATNGVSNGSVNLTAAALQYFTRCGGE